MVCLNDNIPLIRMGCFDIGCYDPKWISSEIRHAADQIGEVGEQFPGEVAESVIGFLREHCRENVISLDLIAEQIRCCLRAIGRPHVAEALRLNAPPIYIHLGELASRAGSGFELGFYAMYGNRLELLFEYGVRVLTLGGLEDALDRLLGSGQKSRRARVCRDRMRGEMVDFARQAACLHARDSQSISLTVKHRG
jgi:hypothetical protein